jgi:hypothetical protein
MIICGQSIRLTHPEQTLLIQLTGVDTTQIKTKRMLVDFIKSNLTKIRSCEPGADLAYRLMINSLPCGEECCLHCKDECTKFKRLSAYSR